VSDALLQAISRFNDTDMLFPENTTIHGMFESAVKEHPDRIAVICDHEASSGGQTTLTYGELNRRANNLAALLRSLGAGPDLVVAIRADRSFAMIVGLMGILKSGAAYLPLSPEGPAERTRYMLEDSGARILVCQDGAQDTATTFGGEVVDLSDPGIRDGSTEDLPPAGGSRDLAYVIYTSGSTGRPKGVMIEHRSVVNRLAWMQRLYPLGHQDIVLQKTPYFFDVSVWELFWWGLYGAGMCLLMPGGERNPVALIDAIERHKVSTLHFVPSMLNVFLDYLEGKDAVVASRLVSVRRVFCSGEALTPSHVKKFNRSLFKHTPARLTNLYGPTEATVDVTYYDCPSGEGFTTIPIGRPIDNTRAFVVREDTLVPVGATGELCIAGVGLARGYINNPALTNEKFVTYPFLPGERVYRTGDVAMWTAEGVIEYLGREDHQVKIRGLRIELGEIESNVREYSGVRDCIVITRQYSESVIVLIAYIVPRGELSVAALKEFLQERLPAYMIPNQFVPIERIPLLANGKADREALPDPRDAAGRPRHA